MPGREVKFLAINDANHLVEAGIDATVVITLLEQWCDRVVDDATRVCIVSAQPRPTSILMA